MMPKSGYRFSENIMLQQLKAGWRFEERHHALGRDPAHWRFSSEAKKVRPARGDKADRDEPVAGRRERPDNSDLIRRARTIVLRLLYLTRACGFNFRCRQNRNLGIGSSNKGGTPRYLRRNVMAACRVISPSK